MTHLETRPTFGSTSAAGAMLMRQVREPVALAGCMFLGLGTSTTSAAPRDIEWCVSSALEQTTAGAAVSSTPSSGSTIGELRRLSGFTWDQLARLFGVSRRSLHFWASGKPMTPSNEEHLQRVLAVLRKIDRGSSSATRTALLGAREDGIIPFDLLAERDYERVVSLLGSGGSAGGAAPTRVSAESRAARAPRPPEELVGALQDRVHPTSGRLLAAKPITTTRRT